MTKRISRHNISIPNNVSVFYSEEKQLATFVGPSGQKSLKLKVKLMLLTSENIIIVKPQLFDSFKGKSKKKIKALQGTTISLLKQSLIEVSVVLYQKLKFIGVGYRAFVVDDYKNDLFMFKLGCSHPVYFKIPKELSLFCLKSTTLFIFGNSYSHVKQVAASIRTNKKPEPYKGKGILYENEKIVLKEGKKV